MQGSDSGVATAYQTCDEVVLEIGRVAFESHREPSELRCPSVEVSRCHGVVNKILSPHVRWCLPSLDVLLCLAPDGGVRRRAGIGVVGEQEVGREVDALTHIETQCRYRNRGLFVPLLYAWNDGRGNGERFVTSKSVGR